MDSREAAERIARKTAELGGRTFYVGGCVRDELMGRPCKDIDIEVHGIYPAQLEAILDSIGERVSMGASFGVFGLKGCMLDIAMPRKENATGRGHRDFEIFVDPFIGTENAARRRDFTVNAIMKDVLSGEIVDPFAGRQDIEAGILRCVNPKSFREDPLRVLRAAQFAARFGFKVEEETMRICSGMDLSTLAKERIEAELMKALLQAEKPSVFFETLQKMDQLDFWFPEIGKLTGVPQDPKWHSEGDVWNHTMLVLDAAASMRFLAKDPRAFLLAALLHDIGKPAATFTDPTGRIRSFGHEEKGVKIGEVFLSRLTGEVQLKKQVENLILLHMRPNMLVGQNSGTKAYMKMFDSALCPEDLLLLAKADRMGQTFPGDYAPAEALLQEKLRLYRELEKTPPVTGSELIAAGLRPGKEFRDLLDHARVLWLSGVSHDTALREVLTMAERKEKKQKEKTLATLNHMK